MMYLTGYILKKDKKMNKKNISGKTNSVTNQSITQGKVI